MEVLKKNKSNKSQKLWNKAKKIIPGGTMLFSKNPNLYLPGYWPTYYLKAKGCFLWDLGNRKLIDMCMMGIGTNILGYANSDVNKEVIKATKDGNISTLNCVEEIKLAEKLISIHPWAQKAKFARSGGEASAIALRIARAATNKNNVAVCGYHGWHDWYLSTNLTNKNNLNKHLFKDVSIKGVPSNLKKSCFTFEYNNFESLKKIVSKYNIGTIFMEVERDQKPNINFLQKVKNYSKKKNIVLIFDECSSGFRETFGGLHLKYKIYPDIVIYGKCIGNGYPINPIIGKKKIMNYAEDTFISSTFWTERLGYVAALKTIELMKKNKTFNYIKKTGIKIKNNWKKIAKKNGIEIKIYSLDSIPKFEFKSKKNLLYKTFLTQEFLKVNILANTTVYVSTFHTEKILKNYFKNLDLIFSKISYLEKNKIDIKKKLRGNVCQKGMRDSKINEHKFYS